MSLFGPTVAVPPQAGRYHVLYQDPPWPERGGGQIKRGADKHYDLMDVDAIVDLFRTFGEWSAPDAHLYCWVTNNYLQAGLDCLKAAGFRYVTICTWVKDRPGLGQYFRGKTEHVLFAVRGSLPYRVKADGKRAQGETVFYAPEPTDLDLLLPADLPDAFEAPRREHSKKPEEMRRIIECVSAGPYLEQFARRTAPGWDVWGAEAPKEQ